MDKHQLLDRLERITIAKRSRRRAMYKPLLLLLLFQRASREHGRTSFKEVEGPLRDLIHRFSPLDSPDSVGQPWWHLPTDNLWCVFAADGTVLRESGTPRGELSVPSLDRLRMQYGQFPKELQKLLSEHPEVAEAAMHRVLDLYFPAEEHEAVTSSLGFLPPKGDDKRLLHYLRRPYQNIGSRYTTRTREPFDVDPDEVDRANQAHAITVNALADFLRSHRLTPCHPVGEPECDLVWRAGGFVYAAEIKSITDRNEEKQLRLGLGQVLRYRQYLEGYGANVRPVLVPARTPSDANWLTLCASVGVRLAWPGAFESLLS